MMSNTYFRDGTQLTDLLSLLLIFACAMLRICVREGRLTLPTTQAGFNPLLLCQLLYGLAAIIFFARPAVETAMCPPRRPMCPPRRAGLARELEVLKL